MLRRRSTVNAELMLVGAGYRGVSFLAANPDLLELDLAVVERSSTIGPNAFRRYEGWTTSLGFKFFEEVRTTGPFAALAHSPEFLTVASAQAPVSMPRLADALEALAATLATSLGDRLHTGQEVAAVDVDTETRVVSVRLASGKRLQARHLVLATGRYEVTNPWIADAGPAVMMSERFISRDFDLTRYLSTLGPGPRSIVIVGASHSAMSALERFLKARAAAKREDVHITVLRRSPARFTYPDLDTARRMQVPGREREAGLDDVCPVSGVAFRDSGLRNRARELYSALWSGGINGAELVSAISGPSGVTNVLSGASLIVQATGYSHRLPHISVDGITRSYGSNTGQLSSGSDGAAILDHRRLSSLSFLRVGQTPQHLRDNSAYGAGLYRRLRHRVLADLDMEPAT